MPYLYNEIIQEICAPVLIERYLLHIYYIDATHKSVRIYTK